MDNTFLCKGLMTTRKASCLPIKHYQYKGHECLLYSFSCSIFTLQELNQVSISKEFEPQVDNQCIIDDNGKWLSLLVHIRKQVFHILKPCIQCLGSYLWLSVLSSQPDLRPNFLSWVAGLNIMVEASYPQTYTAITTWLIWHLMQFVWKYFLY